MAAICGFASSRDAAEDDLSPMLNALRDYGDSASRWANGNAAFGLRCAVADVGPPISVRVDARAGLAVAADARLDNRRDLAADLGLPASQRDEADAAELVLRAFKRWGGDCADRLLGDFAFAVYSQRSRELFLARDPVGVRPLYYALGKGRLVFGSSIEAVLAAPEVSNELNEVAIAEMLTSRVISSRTRTFYRAVRRLPAGHSLVFARGKVRLHRHWRPERLPRRRPSSDAVVLDEMLELFEQAVRDRLVGGPVGVELSGGLDSTAVIALAVRQLEREGRPPPTALTLLPTPPPRATMSEEHQREYDAAQRVASSLNLRLRHHTYSVSALVEALRADATFPGRMSAASMLSLAKELGVRVVLTGFGGDQGGISHDGREISHDLLLRARLPSVFRTARERGLSPLRHLAGLSLEFLHPRLPDAVLRLRDGRRANKAPWLINPEFARTVRTQRRRVHRRLGVRHRQLMSLRSPQKADGLENEAAETAAFGIEARHPMLDRRLLEFGLCLPPEYYWRNGEGRWLMRRAVARLLPEYGNEDAGKRDRVKVDAMAEQMAQALPIVRQLLEERTTPPERAQYLDLPRLLDALDAERFLANPKPLIIQHALGLLKF